MSNTPRDITELLEKVKAKYRVISDWTDKQILDKLESLIPELPKNFNTKILEEFDERQRFCEWKDEITIPFKIPDEQLEELNKLFELSDEEETLNWDKVKERFRIPHDKEMKINWDHIRRTSRYSTI